MGQTHYPYSIFKIVAAEIPKKAPKADGQKGGGSGGGNFAARRAPKTCDFLSGAIFKNTAKKKSELFRFF